MKKKTIIFSCFALLFLLSAFSGFSNDLISGGVGCLIICCIFTFLAFRSTSLNGKYEKTQQSSNRFTSSTDKNSISQPLQDNTVNTHTAVPLSIKPKSDNSVISPVPNSHVQRQTKYIFVPIRIVGVTFDNDDGISRQLILRKLKSHESPFTEYADIEIKQYEFKGQPAYGVYANDMQIGNIPADLVPFLQENVGRIESISHIDVYGGGERNGNPISYGCKITLRFLKDNPPTNIPDTLKINN